MLCQLAAFIYTWSVWHATTDRACQWGQCWGCLWGEGHWWSREYTDIAPCYIH